MAAQRAGAARGCLWRVALRLEPVGLGVELPSGELEGVDGCLVAEGGDEPAAAGRVGAELGAGLGVHGNRINPGYNSSAGATSRGRLPNVCTAGAMVVVVGSCVLFA